MSVYTVYKFFREVRDLSALLQMSPNAGPVELLVEAGFFPILFAV